LETAKELALKGFHVVLGRAYSSDNIITIIRACRDSKKCAIAIDEIKKYCYEKLPRSSPLVEGMKLDLSSLQSVEKFVSEFRVRHIPLHVLVNNAGTMYHNTHSVTFLGVFMPPLSHTSEGYEMQFGVNYLAQFKLTLLLLDVMIQTNSGRIINVCSRAHKCNFVTKNNNKYISWKN
jgi:NAD(P)-dependent dehydrogenase (short-subunit alcohol dehydrogenase family)